MIGAPLELQKGYKFGCRSKNDIFQETGCAENRPKAGGGWLEPLVGLKKVSCYTPEKVA